MASPAAAGAAEAVAEAELGDTAESASCDAVEASARFLGVEDDALATLFETLFDIKVAVYEIRDELLGDESEEEEDA